MAGSVCPAWGSFLFAENWFIPQSGRHTLFPKLSDLIGIECFKPFLAGFSPSWPFHFSCLPDLDPSAKSCPAPTPRPRSVVTTYHSAEKVFLPGMPPDTHNTHLQSPPPKLQGLLRNNHISPRFSENHASLPSSFLNLDPSQLALNSRGKESQLRRSLCPHHPLP